MNISNLTPGQTYKNYKELCKVLNVSTKTGNSKKSQLKEWERYFDYTLEGHKYTINCIYETPLEKIENRGGARHLLLHSDRMGTILTYIIDQEKEKELFVPISLLLKLMSMINDNYNFGNRNRKKVSKYLDIEEKLVEEFFDISKRTFKRNIESMLDRLESRSLLYWHKVKTVCVANVRTNTNTYGNIKADYEIVKDEYDNEEIVLDANARATREFREATAEEIKLILDIEGKVLDDLKCENKQELIIKNKYPIFIKEVNKRLFDEANILFYYDSYRIIRNMERLEREVNKIEDTYINETQYAIESVLLNLEVQNQLKDNTISRQQRSISEKEIKKENSKINMRLSPNYIDHNLLMIDTFINMGHDDIRTQLKLTRIN